MKKTFLFLISYSLFLSAVPVLAQNNDTYYCHGKTDKNGAQPCMIAENGKGSCPNGFTEDTISCKCGPDSPHPGDECIQLDNPLKSGTTDIPTLIGIAIKAVLGIIGAVTLLMFFWGGRSWIMAAGNAEKIKSGTETMTWAAIGTLFVFASYLMVNIVIKFIAG